MILFYNQHKKDNLSTKKNDLFPVASLTQRRPIALILLVQDCDTSLPDFVTAGLWSCYRHHRNQNETTIALHADSIKWSGPFSSFLLLFLWKKCSLYPVYTRHHRSHRLNVGACWEIRNPKSGTEIKARLLFANVRQPSAEHAVEEG